MTFRFTFPYAIMFWDGELHNWTTYFATNTLHKSTDQPFKTPQLFSRNDKSVRISRSNLCFDSVGFKSTFYRQISVFWLFLAVRIDWNTNSPDPIYEQVETSMRGPTQHYDSSSLNLRQTPVSFVVTPEESNNDDSVFLVCRLFFVPLSIFETSRLLGGSFWQKSGVHVFTLVL